MFLIVQVLTSSIYCRTGTLVHQVLGLGLIWLSILTNTSDGVKTVRVVVCACLSSAIQHARSKITKVMHVIIQFICSFA